MPSESLKPTALAIVGQGPQYVDRQTGLIEDVHPVDAVDIVDADFERGRGRNDLAFGHEDLLDPVQNVLCFSSRGHGERVLVLIGELPCLVGT